MLYDTCTTSEQTVANSSDAQGQYRTLPMAEGFSADQLCPGRFYQISHRAFRTRTSRILPQPHVNFGLFSG